MRFGLNGLDTFFLFCGNYPREIQNNFIPDHYVMAILPYVILIEQLVFYVDRNTCEGIFYICLRRRTLWKQAVHDLVRIGVLVFVWLICYQVLLGSIFFYFYGTGGVSCLLQQEFSTGQLYWLLLLFSFRQSVIFFILASIAYLILLRLGSSCAVILLIGLSAAMVLTVFSGAKISFALNLCSFQMAGPVILLLLVWGGIACLRKHLLEIYLRM